MQCPQSYLSKTTNIWAYISTLPQISNNKEICTVNCYSVSNYLTIGILKGIKQILFLHKWIYFLYLYVCVRERARMRQNLWWERECWKKPCWMKFWEQSTNVWIFRREVMVDTLVCPAYHNKIPQTGCFKQEFIFWPFGG